jgi:hypothetical protein
MKKVTFSAKEGMIKRARMAARAQGKTLNEAILGWLVQFSQQNGSAQEYHALMQRLSHVRPGRRFTRDELNER